MLNTLLKHCENPSKLRIFLIIDNVSPGQLSAVMPYLFSTVPSLSVLRADASLVGDYPVSGHGSAAAYFRLLMPGLLPEECNRIIFVDSDAVVTDGLEELWNLSLDGKSLAAVPEHWICCDDHGYPRGSYFNT